MAAMRPARTAHAIAERERTSDVLTEENSNVDFASMFLSDFVTDGLQKVGFEKPSPIQLKAIPLGRCGLDLIVQAKSGTGKTCVFTVIALESLDLTSPSTQVLVLAPTREIAVQIQETIQAIGCEMDGLRCHVFIGGTLFGPDRQKLKKCHVAVGTPGRIKQLIEYDVLKTSSIRLFVLDEADKLLDDNFQEQVNWVYNNLPDNKQMLALSATYPEYLAKHLTKYMREPTFVRLNPRDLALRGIKQLFVELPGHSLPNKAFEIKVIKLLQILTQVSFNQCLIFSNLQTRAQNLCDILCGRGWPSECISGHQEQAQRLSAMSKLKKFQCRILISTDLTARGIDAENVNLIINLDIPTDSKTYLHRIGRAGRFGTHGAAISLACRGRDVDLLKNIQRQCRVQMTALPDPAPSDLLKQDLGSGVLSEAADTISTDPLSQDKEVDHRTSSQGFAANDEDDGTTHTTAGHRANSEAEVNGECSDVLQEVTAFDEMCTNMKANHNDHKADKLNSPDFVQNIDGLSAESDKLLGRHVSKDDAVREDATSKACRHSRNGHRPLLVGEMDSAPRTDEVGVQTDPVDGKITQDTEQAHTGSRSSVDLTVQKKPVLPLGFEDTPEVMNLHFPSRSRWKGRESPRRMLSWHEAKKSCEDFMKKQFASDMESCKDLENDVGDNILKEEKMESANGEVIADKPQIAEDESNPDVVILGEIPVDSSCEVSRRGEATVKTEKCYHVSPFTPLKQIQLYRGALLADAFIHKSKDISHTDEIVSSVRSNVDIHSDEIYQRETPDPVPSQIVGDNIPQDSRIFQGRRAGDDMDAVNDHTDVKCSTIKTTEQTDKHNVNILSNTDAANGKTEMIINDQVSSNMKETTETEENNQGSRTPSDGQSSSEPKNGQATSASQCVRKNKPPVKVAAKKRGKQRIKEHVFAMSTLGALMSHQELNMVISGIQNGCSQKSYSGKDSLQEEYSPNTELHDSATKCHTDDSIDHNQPKAPLHVPDYSSATGTKSNNLGEVSAIQNSESRFEKGRDEIVQEELTTQTSNTDKNNSDGDQGISEGFKRDPVWAIFKGYITKTPAVDKEESTRVIEVDSSSGSSSSFCESDTSSSSTCEQDEGSEDDLRSDDEVDEEDSFELEEDRCDDKVTVGIDNAFGNDERASEEQKQCSRMHKHAPTKVRGELGHANGSRKSCKSQQAYENGWDVHQNYPYSGQYGSGTYSGWNAGASGCYDDQGQQQWESRGGNGAPSNGDYFSGWYPPYHESTYHGYESGVQGHWYPGVSGAGDHVHHMYQDWHGHGLDGLQSPSPYYQPMMHGLYYN